MRIYADPPSRRFPLVLTTAAGWRIHDRGPYLSRPHFLRLYVVAPKTRRSYRFWLTWSRTFSRLVRGGDQERLARTWPDYLDELELEIREHLARAPELPVPPSTSTPGDIP